MLGQALGLTDAEFDALQGDDYRGSPLFSAREKAAMGWAEAMTLNTAKNDDAVWDETRRLFSDAEIVAEATETTTLATALGPTAPWQEIV